ncbi:MAG: hypothetical protein EOO48_03660 [Flavobacterium sp.]|nr:MAG: hypothetical protein EOO48_03660 [Flavobacterium sp.]
MAEFPERNPENYIWKIFYYNKKDSRTYLPKSNPDWGTTVNFAKPQTFLFLLLAIGFFAFVITMILTHQK